MQPNPLTALVLLSACAGNPGPPNPTANPPNRLILISIDGFRPDYLDRPAATRLRTLAARGVRATLIPPFPTKTFPSHYTIVTGLYPEHHGIVANTMVDSTIDYRFVSTDSASVADPRWWGGEPIWVTAIAQGRRAATMGWPGSEAPIHGIRPTYWRRFDPRLPNAARFRQLLDWLALPGDSAPTLLTLYLNPVDVAGHRGGPRSPAVDSAIAVVDSSLGALIDSLAGRGLLQHTNLIVLSDHGMTDAPPDQLIYLDDLVDLATVELADLNPVAAIYPKPGLDTLVYHRLHHADPHLAVYRKGDVPARLHFRDHPRISPILGLAEEGWTITTHRARPPTDRGNHGYDPALASMAAVFIGSGPDFARNRTVAPFQSVHLYSLLAHLLRLRPAPNDGRLDQVLGLLRRP